MAASSVALSFVLFSTLVTMPGVDALSGACRNLPDNQRVYDLCKLTSPFRGSTDPDKGDDGSLIRPKYLRSYGQRCGASFWMKVFYADVLPDETITIEKPVATGDNRKILYHDFRWGNQQSPAWKCPVEADWYHTQRIVCTDKPNTGKQSWTNDRGNTKRVYVTVQGMNQDSSGSFTLSWTTQCGTRAPSTPTPSPTKSPTKYPPTTLSPTPPPMTSAQSNAQVNQLFSGGIAPSHAPTARPTFAPSHAPTPRPTFAPSHGPTAIPSASPTKGVWGDWGACSSPCNGGTQTRVCDGGADCVGDAEQRCNVHSCSASDTEAAAVCPSTAGQDTCDGLLGSCCKWTSGACQAKAGAGTCAVRDNMDCLCAFGWGGTRFDPDQTVANLFTCGQGMALTLATTAGCDNNGCATCEDIFSDAKEGEGLANFAGACCPLVPVDGNWGDFSDCSAACGGGTQTRACDNPAPADGGADCNGDTEQACNEQQCPTALPTALPSTLPTAQPTMAPLVVEATATLHGIAETAFSTDAKETFERAIATLLGVDAEHVRVISVNGRAVRRRLGDKLDVRFIADMKASTEGLASVDDAVKHVAEELGDPNTVAAALKGADPGLFADVAVTVKSVVGAAPTAAPTAAAPTPAPTERPTAAPTDAPTTAADCSMHSRCVHSFGFSRGQLCCPTKDGATFLSCCDNTEAPTGSPSRGPSPSPSQSPTPSPTAAPTTATDPPTEAPEMARADCVNPLNSECWGQFKGVDPDFPTGSLCCPNADGEYAACCANQPAAAAAATGGEEEKEEEAAGNAAVYGAVGGGFVFLAIAAGLWHYRRGKHPHHHRQYHRRASERSAKMGIEMPEDAHQPHARRGGAAAGAKVIEMSENPMTTRSEARPPPPEDDPSAAAAAVKHGEVMSPNQAAVKEEDSSSAAAASTAIVLQ